MWIAIAPQPWCPEWQAPLVAAGAAITPAMVWRQRVLLLDIQASLQWLGGVRGLKHTLHHELATLNITGHAVMAHTATGAWLLAIDQTVHPKSWTWCYALSATRLAKRLDGIVIDRLPETKPFAPWFTRLGCHTLGDLRALDRSELLARTNDSLLSAIDQAYGHAPFGYQPLALPMQFHERLELPRLIEDAGALEPYTKRLLHTLCAWLSANHLAVSRLQCRLHHRDRQRARAPTTIVLALAKPSDQPTVLWRWLSVRLERMALPAVVSDITIFTCTLSVRQTQNLSLFDDTDADHDTWQTLDLLRARLGQAGVKQARLHADYRPEVANAWQTLDDTQALPTSAPMPDTGAHCPAWLLPEPRALSTRQDQPYLQGRLRLLQGPWRIETGWWDTGLAARDYFVASDESSRRYWIYRERGQPEARWFLHGLFG
jgi:protein ImuB